jgi:SAM-dependent methyltransferase
MASSNGCASPVSLVGSDAGIAFYRRQVGQLEQPVLILGCANGRMAWELGADLPLVVGVDPSPRMIALAEEGRVHQSAESASRVRFVSADLRSLRLAEKFAAVLAPNNALGLMGSPHDLEAAIATARYHLLPDGFLAFDTVNPTHNGRALQSETEVFPSEPRMRRAPLTLHLRERRRTGPGAGQAIRRLRLRQFMPAEIDAALEEGGFVATSRYGRYDEKPFEPSDALQIVIATLRER